MPVTLLFQVNKFPHYLTFPPNSYVPALKFSNFLKRGLCFVGFSNFYICLPTLYAGFLCFLLGTPPETF